MQTEKAADLLCKNCGAPMKFVRSVPRLGPHPELASYVCAKCGHVETRAVEAK
jgi:predicted RNA-binding Zn-ribbon protein involved in translation (DUF1610 family)